MQYMAKSAAKRKNRWLKLNSLAAGAKGLLTLEAQAARKAIPSSWQMICF
jgi:hypothetical protein